VKQSMILECAMQDDLMRVVRALSYTDRLMRVVRSLSSNDPHLRPAMRKRNQDAVEFIQELARENMQLRTELSNYEG
jgi:uncharacterized protein (DUF2236 family)